MEITIRKITKEDNETVEKIIRSVLEEHGVNRPGTAYFDETLKNMSDSHSILKSVYYIAQLDGKTIGGSGVYPTEGLPEGTCELVKMYLLPEARGKGIAKILIEKCMQFARENGYAKMYLETMNELKTAVGMYEKFGFSELGHALGNSGHYACTIRMIKLL